jgi:hypothetical protein
MVRAEAWPTRDSRETRQPSSARSQLPLAATATIPPTSSQLLTTMALALKSPALPVKSPDSYTFTVGKLGACPTPDTFVRVPRLRWMLPQMLEWPYASPSLRCTACSVLNTRQILLGERAHLIEFPSLLLPPGATTGSIVNILVTQNTEAERKRDSTFWELQDDILATFGRRLPTAPEITVRRFLSLRVTRPPPAPLPNIPLRFAT